MAVAGEQQRLTEVLLDEISETNFPSVMQLDRIERLISTREELEDYIGILMHTVQSTKFPAGHMLDRLERLLRVLQRVDQEARSER